MSGHGGTIAPARTCGHYAHSDTPATGMSADTTRERAEVLAALGRIALWKVDFVKPIDRWQSLTAPECGELELHEHYVVWRPFGMVPVMIPLYNVVACYPLYPNTV